MYLCAQLFGYVGYINVSSPVLDTLDTYLPSRIATSGGYNKFSRTPGTPWTQNFRPGGRCGRIIFAGGAREKKKGRFCVSVPFCVSAPFADRSNNGGFAGRSGVLSTHVHLGSFRRTTQRATAAALYIGRTQLCRTASFGRRHSLWL